MKDLSERMPEFLIVNWRGAEVRISIELPWNRKSMTFQHILDSRDLDILKDLIVPKQIKFLEGQEKYFHLMQ